MYDQILFVYLNIFYFQKRKKKSKNYFFENILSVKVCFLNEELLGYRGQCRLSEAWGVVGTFVQCNLPATKPRCLCLCEKKIVEESLESRLIK